MTSIIECILFITSNIAYAGIGLFICSVLAYAGTRTTNWKDKIISCTVVVVTLFTIILLRKYF